MGSKKNFNKFTYGVGLEVNASSFKQVNNSFSLTNGLKFKNIS